jgi:hypothetical protein
VDPGFKGKLLLLTGSRAGCSPSAQVGQKGMIEKERVLRSSNREAAAMRSNVELHSEAADVPAAASDCARHPNCSNRFDTFVRADCQSDRLVPRIS